MIQGSFWDTPQRILVILAHPDDPEFFCGATIAKWTQENHEVIYCLLTRGEKGINKVFNNAQDIIQIREHEQKLAAKEVGVEKIEYLDCEDGYIKPDFALRKDIVRKIRKIKPDIVVTCDPTNFYIQDSYINHPDHRAAGQAVLDAVFPASQNPLFFPELKEEELEPHDVKEVWISLPKEPNVKLDVTAFWQKKIKALLKHQSQIGDEEKFIQRTLEKHTDDSDEEHPRYEESFVRIVFRKQ